MDSLGNNLGKPKEDNIEEREKRSLYLIEFLKRIDIRNIVEDPKKKSEFVQNLSFEEFKNFLLRINGILRNTSTPKRDFNTKSDDRQRIFNITEEGKTIYTPPPNKLKIELLEGTFNAFKRMNLEGRVRDGALMLGYAINAIHPFENGNGRTARNISMLLASSKGKFLVFQVNPASLQPYIENYLSSNVHHVEPFEFKSFDTSEINFPDATSKEDLIDLHHAFDNDMENFITACSIFAKNNGESLKESFFDPSTQTFTIKRFFSKYEKDMGNIVNTYREFKKECVKLLIDIFENPTKYYVKNMTTMFNLMSREDRKHFAKTTLRDVFLKDSNKDSIQGREFSWDYLIKFIKGEVK